MSNTFPTGTRWVQVQAFDATGRKLGHATADCLNYSTPNHANSAAMHAIVKAYGDAVASVNVFHG